MVRSASQPRRLQGGESDIMQCRKRPLGLAAMGLIASLGWSGATAAAAPGFVEGEVVVTHYPPGGNDDLLTAGLGSGGLQTPPVPGAPQPTVTDPRDPAQLRRNVTSPNGTTQAALEVLMGEDGFPSLLERAVEAARARAEELSKG